MQGKKHSQVDDDANHCRGDARQWRGESQLSMSRFDQRPAGENKNETRQKREPRGNGCGESAGCEQLVRTEHLLAPAPDKADERNDHDQRPGRRFAERESIDHLRRREPAVGLHGPLHDVRQDRVRASKGDQRRLGEEPAHLRQRAGAA